MLSLIRSPEPWPLRHVGGTGDPRSRAADRLGLVIVRIFMHHDRESVRVEQDRVGAHRSGRFLAGLSADIGIEEGRRRTAIGTGIDVRHIGAFIALWVQQAMAIAVRIDMAAGSLEAFSGIRAVADLVQVDTMPALREAFEIDAQQNAVGPVDQAGHADAAAVRAGKGRVDLGAKIAKHPLRRHRAGLAVIAAGTEAQRPPREH